MTPDEGVADEGQTPPSGQNTADALPGAPEATETPENMYAWRQRWGWRVPHPSQDYRDQLKVIYCSPNPLI